MYKINHYQKRTRFAISKQDIANFIVGLLVALFVLAVFGLVGTLELSAYGK
jgi:hypothetical protein